MISIRKTMLQISFFFFVFAIAVADLSATTFARLKFEDLAEKSNAVARVRSGNSWSYWRSGEIWTSTELEILERSKGTLPTSIRLEMPGGQVGRIKSIVDGVPHFRAGEEAYLFLWVSNGTYQVMGWTQGTFRIERDEKTGMQFVTQDSSSTAIFDPSQRQFAKEGLSHLPLLKFQARLRKALTRSQQIQP